MRTEVARIGKNRVELEVEVDPQRLDDALEMAYRKVVQRVNIPGFRKGKAPRAILERFVGKAPLLEEAVESLVPQAFVEAVSQSRIEPIDEPEYDLVQLEEGKPLIFKAKVDVKPEVKLGQYKGLEVTIPKIAVEDADVERVLRDLQLRHAELAESERTVVQNDDYVLIDFEGFLDGKPFAGGAARDFLLRVGAGQFVPGFEDQLVGAVVGEEREIRVTFPEDYHETRLAGKETTFKVTVKTIKERKIPELDDNFAREVGPFDTLDALREDIRTHLLQDAERERRKYIENAVVEKAAADSEVDPPDVLVEREIEEQLADFRLTLSYRGLKFEDYLAQRNITEDDVRAELRPRAVDAVRKRLMLEAVAKAEAIEVADVEVEERASALAAAYGQKDASRVRERLLSPGRRDLLRTDIAVTKAVRLMAESAKVTELEEAAKPEETGEAEKAPVSTVEPAIVSSEEGHEHGVENQ